MDSPAHRLALPACLESLEEFRRFIREGAAACGIPPVEVDKLDLVMEEILVNVARYAYVPDTGTAEVAYWQSSPGRLRVEVSDQGRGLPAGFDIDLSKGVGMQVVKAFVRRLNAKLSVSSRPGHTTFRIDSV